MNSLQDRRESEPAQRGRAAPRLVLLATYGLVFLPVMWLEVPREAARWCAARALEQHLDGELDGALADMDRALEWDPGSVAWHRQRALWRIERHEWTAALADADQALAAASQDINALQVHSLALQHAGRFADAVTDWKQIAQLAEPARPAERFEVLNGGAYARALAGLELDAGLDAANEALQIEALPALLLDPAGYMHYAYACRLLQREKKSAALDQLDQAATFAEREFQRADHQLQALPAIDPSIPERRAKRNELALHLGRILTQRALVAEQIGDTQPAAADRQRVAQLNLASSVGVPPLINITAAHERLRALAEVLDTRGWLHFAKSDFDAAQRDLERAVRLMDWADRSFPWVEDANRDEVDLRPLRLIAESVRKSMAVLLYHRGRIYEAQGRHDLAVADFERITKLGFPLDDHLF